MTACTDRQRAPTKGGPDDSCDTLHAALGNFASRDIDILSVRFAWIRRLRISPRYLLVNLQGQMQSLQFSAKLPQAKLAPNSTKEVSALYDIMAKAVPDSTH